MENNVLVQTANGNTYPAHRDTSKSSQPLVTPSPRGNRHLLAQDL